MVDQDELSRPVSTFADAAEVTAVGHRIVHGGEHYRPTVIDDTLFAKLTDLVELAPLHNAPAVAAIAEARQRWPDVDHVAVFDTAFHHTLPAVASTFLLPERFRERGIRRYGFHGLSVAWASAQVDFARVVVCHLGGGCSVTAVLDGTSVDTSMGFTPLDGVPMASRAGAVDPGVLIYLLRHGVKLDDLEHALEHESGLVGLAGTGDVSQIVLDTAPQSSLALEIYCYRVAQAVAAMATALAGIDALVFTAGVGEHSERVRAVVCAQLAFLGVALDADANAGASGDADITAPGSPVAVRIVTAREDVMIARGVRSVLAGDSLHPL
ncbi:MAG: acetate/propionate family kinase [Actinobacteria bacterium]|nr:acetate/propionate family kinase [Actinomycetota bacterium]